MDSDARPTETPRLSRRDMLRRSALVGGTMVWTVPAIQTLAGPAFAAGSPAGENPPCRYTAFVKYEPGVGFSDSEGVGNANCVPAACAQPNVTVDPLTATTAALISGGTTIGTVSATGPDANDCYVIDFNWSSPGCNINESSSYFVFKDGGANGCEADDSGTLSQVDLNAATDTYRICGSGLPGGNGGGAISHIDFCLCVACTA